MSSGTKFLEAAEAGNINMLRQLLEARTTIDTSYQNEEGWTALMKAAWNGHTDIVKVLVEAGSELDKQDKDGQASLMRAACNGHAQVVSILVAAGADREKQGIYGQTALMKAAEYGHVEVLRILLQAGADKNKRSHWGKTALISAALNGHTEVIKMLVEAGASKNKQDNDGNTALILAAEEGHSEVVQILVDAGAVKSKQNKLGNTALMKAAEEGHFEALSILLKAGANKEQQNGYGNWALMKAADNGHVEIVKVLVAAGANIDKQNLNGHSAMMKAAEEGHAQVVKIFVEAGANKDIQDNNGWTALMKAADNNHADIVIMLLRAGADMNKQDKDGWTALMRAADGSHAEMVKILVEAGANKDIKDKNGKTALDLAKIEKTWNLLRTTPNGNPTASDLEALTAPTTALSTPRLAVPNGCGTKEWRRARLNVAGASRAGNTALINALMGKTFEETTPTVGIAKVTCEAKQGKANSASGPRQQQWGETKRGQGCREYEAALAELMSLNKHDGEQARTAGADVREYMKSLLQATTLNTSCQSQPVDNDESSPTSSGKESTSTTAGSPSSVAAVRAAELACDEEMVMKLFAAIQDEPSELLISLFDFGGQNVFDVINHLFLARNGVYVLVFHMDWLFRDGPKKEKALRFMQAWLSMIAVHTFDKATQMTAPIVLVGTHLDLVPSPAAHATISTLLHEHFSNNPAWRSLIQYEIELPRQAKVAQCFFPVDNKLGLQSTTMQQLKSALQGALESAPYTHQYVPLSWFKLIDLISDSKRNCLSLSEVSTMASACGIAESEIPLFLAFQHDAGALLWNAEPELRGVVILDPISFLVAPATTIICQLRPDLDDTTHHFKQSHKECAKLHKHEWAALKNDGVLSIKLLPILWKEYFHDRHVLLALMVKYGLLVPLRVPFGEEATVSQYLVPTLLPPSPDGDARLLNWSAEVTPLSSVYFVFAQSHELGAQSTIVEADLKNLAFLPGGLFERLVGKVLSWAQDTAIGACIDLHNTIHYKDMAVLSFGRQRFRIAHCADIHCVRVDIEGSNPIVIQEKLMNFVSKVLAECMVSLHCFPALSYASNNADSKASTLASSPGKSKKATLSAELLVPLQQVRAAAKGESMLAWRGGRTLLSTAEIETRYAQWLQPHSLSERYDVFIGYRRGTHDSLFAEALFDMFTNFRVGEQDRAVEVLLGREMKSDSAAVLCDTLVAVPMVTMEALDRLLVHAPDRVDDLLLEWIIMIECFAAKRIQDVCPILFGRRAPASLLGGAQGDRGAAPAGKARQKDFFIEYGHLAIPKTVPTATLARAAELLRANNVPLSARFHSLTVHYILAELLEFSACKATDYGPVELTEACARKVMNALSQCGEADLFRIISAKVPPMATPVAAPVAALVHSASAPLSVHKPACTADSTAGGKVNEVVEEIRAQLRLSAEMPDEQVLQQALTFIKRNNY